TGAGKATNSHSRFIEDNFCFKTWRMRPVSIDYLERLAKQLMDWFNTADDLKKIKINQFLELNGINWQSYLRWLDKCPLLKETNDYVTGLIGNLREQKLLDKKDGWNERPLMFVHHLYCSKWDAANKYHSDLKKQ